MTEVAVAGAGLDERARGALVRSGADLVDLVERLYVRLFGIALALVAGAGALAAVYARLQPSDWHGGLTAGLAGVCTATALLARRGGPRTYLWLRRRGRALPALLSGLVLLVGGPGGPLWFVGLACIVLTAVLAAPRQTIALALVVTGCYMLGTWLPGASLIVGGDVGRLAAAAGLALDGVLGVAVVELLARFVLQLHQLERKSSGWRPPPVAVGDVGGIVGRPTRRIGRALPRGPSRLTARQLEVVVLLRDGLRQEEIAGCLGVSARQVERLVAQARARVGAETTAALVALLVRGGLVPPPSPDEDG